MRTTPATRAGGLRLPLLCAFLALAMGLGAVGTVTGSSGDPTAVASKKKCKKGPKKCSPRRYHLSASGTDTFRNSSFSQTWSAEVELSRRRASIGEVDYAQDGGTVTLSASFVTEDCPGGEGMVTVQPQTVAVPPASLNQSDFLLFFSLLGKDKNKYALITGETLNSSLSNIKASGTKSCPDGTSIPITYNYSGTGRDAPPTRGRPGNSPLRGSVSSADHSVRWTLTKK